MSQSIILSLGLWITAKAVILVRCYCLITESREFPHRIVLLH